jgi:hypothetical protein
MDESFVTIIRVATGLTMLAFGISQLKDPQDWKGYIPRLIEKRLPETLSTVFMRLHGGINVTLGLLYAAGIWGVFIAWATFAWWLSILPFAFYYNWKIGMRDLAIVAATLVVAMALT